MAGGSTPTTTSAEYVAPLAVGGYRDMSVTRTSGFNTAGLAVGFDAGAGEGIMAFSTGFGTKASASITWDGIGSSGLGGLDLVIGADPYFEIDLYAADLSVTALTYTLTIMDTSSATATYTANFTGTDAEKIYFADFTGTADFSSVDSIMLTLTSTTNSLDAALTQVLVVATDMPTVPVPASAMLLGTGLLGFAALRRKS